MVVNNAISETEAVRVAGVSARTLSRFSEAGYLTVQVESDGQRLYQKDQLAEIFGAFQWDAELNTDQGCVAVASEGACASEEGESPSPVSEPQQAATGTYYSTATATPFVARVVSTEESSANHSSELQATQEEIAKLKNVLALQERILDMKDGEIADLRSQRDWLRTRVEKLEEKGDRDQVLLLSETQAIRQLIGLQQQKRSTVRNILEWFGLTSSEPIHALPMNNDLPRGERSGNGSTIEVNKASNS